MSDQVANAIKVTVSGTYDADDVAITLRTGHGAELPDPSGDNYNLSWWDSANYPDPADDPKFEIVRVTAKAGDVITVSRAQESTEASLKNTSAATYKMILGVTAKTITDLIDETSAVGVGLTTHMSDTSTHGVDEVADVATVSAEIDSDISTHESNGNAHHAEAHSIASHNDTTATGAELEDLTDGSDVDALHAHGANDTHRTSSGSDHAYIDQSVVSGASPAFLGTNITVIPATNIDAGINTEILSAARTLLTSDERIQWFDPDGTDRDVTLPAEASSTNLIFIILNTANGVLEDLVIKNDTPTTIATLLPGMTGIFSCDGVDWKWESNTGIKYDAIENKVYINATSPLFPATAGVQEGFYVANKNIVLERNDGQTPQIKIKSDDPNWVGLMTFKDQGTDEQWIIRTNSSDNSTDPDEFHITEQYHGDAWAKPFKIAPQSPDDSFAIDPNGVGIGTDPDRQLHIKKVSALTDAIQQVARITHVTSGTPAAGIGVGLEFEQETSADNNEIIAIIEAIMTDVTGSSEDADLVFKVMTAGAAATEKLRITSEGLINGRDIAADGTKLDTTASAVDIWLPAEAAYLPVTNPAGLVEELGSTTYAGHSHLTFDDTTSEHAVWRVPMPDYDGGDIVVKAFSKVATTPSEAVTLQYNILTVGLANSEAFDAAATVDTTVNISHSLNTTELLTDIMMASATIDPANVASDDLMIIELSRDVASDNLSGDGELIGIMLEYTRA